MLTSTSKYGDVNSHRRASTLNKSSGPDRLVAPAAQKFVRERIGIGAAGTVVMWASNGGASLAGRIDPYLDVTHGQ